MANEPKTISTILHATRTVAVVGMSNKQERASHHIGKYLAARGYKVFPVNPALQSIGEEKCYPSLEAVQLACQEQLGLTLDLVNVFRAPEYVPAIVDDVIRLKIPYLWLQDGVVHEEAIVQAEAAGVLCVQDDCIYRRHLEMVSTKNCE
jgi:predicted CoA-binding protein